MIGSLIIIEFKKMIHRPRTYLGLVGAALIPMIVIVIFCFNDPTSLFASALGNMYAMAGSILNGYFVSLISLNHGTINFFLPVLIVLVAGEIVSGESQEGTLRVVMTQPVSRLHFLGAKLVTVFIYTLILVVILAAVGLGLGILIFGNGSLLISSIFIGNLDWINILNSSDALIRLLMVFIAVYLLLLTVTSFSFFLSTVLKNPVAAMLFPLFIIILLRIISAFPYMERVKPYLFTTHMDFWVCLLAPIIPWISILKAFSILAVHTGLFVLASFLTFKRKDILV